VHEARRAIDRLTPDGGSAVARAAPSEETTVSATIPDGFAVRDELRAGDREMILRIVRDTGAFADHEVDVAAELIDERARRGDASGYFFLVLDSPGGVAGYACWGPIACTVGSYDLFWVAVDPTLQGRGCGRLLLAEVERRVERARGRRVYIETSSRESYAKTQAFYERCGYRVEARLSDFYAPGDDKLVYAKVIGG
jgi:ribosomal protein S18 acetylase RimI-like enzyme